MNTAGPETPATVIRAFSKRQVMDWSLVLASQDIASTIVHSDTVGWSLEVSPEEYQKALGAIRQFRLENRHWAWRQPIPWSEATFHWGVLGWCLLLILVHWLTSERFPEFRVTGQFASLEVARGEWWRTFTAVLLHADVAHLMANVTIGFVLLGLTMARYGPGMGLLAAYLAGAAGNVAGLLLYQKPYFGVGASGMVMGALGLISIWPFQTWALPYGFRKSLIQAALAGMLLFLLVGVSPKSDVIGHLGGFVVGVLLGLALNALPAPVLRNRWLVAATWFVLGALFIGTGWMALTHR